MGLDPVANRTTLRDSDSGPTTWRYHSQHRITSIVNPLNEEATIHWGALERERLRLLANSIAV